MTGTWNVLKASVLLHMLDNLLNAEAIVILVAAHYIHQVPGEISSDLYRV